MTPEQRDALIARYLDGRADAQHVAMLDAAVRADPDTARALVTAARIDADLRLAHRTEDVSGASVTQRLQAAERQAGARSARLRRSRNRIRQPSSFLRLALPLAIAALLAVAVGLLWFRPSPPAPFIMAGRSAPAGAPLHGVITVAGGGTVTLSADAQATSDGTPLHPRLVLRQGRADCTIAPRTQGGGFTVLTPHGESSVIGTSFSVSTGLSTAVEVASGIVEISAGGRSARIAAGGRAEIRAGQAPVALQAIDTPLPHSLDGWNNNDQRTKVISAGLGPFDLPVLEIQLPDAYGWAGCIWDDRPQDWSKATGISLLLRRSAEGIPLTFELIDNGPQRKSRRGRDAYERFTVPLVINGAGWQEIRIPFTSLTRRDDVWPGLPNDGLTLTQVHGISLIGGPTAQVVQVARIGTYH